MRTVHFYTAFAVLLVGVMFPSVQGQQILVRDSAWGDLQIPAYDRPVNPNLYLVRQGEILTVTFVKTSLPELRLTINAEGKLVHPTLGTYDLHGMTLTQVREALRAPLARHYNAEMIDISIGGPTLVTITVLGAVTNPGTYRGWTSQRVSEVIALAGGLTSEGSSRRISFTGGPAAVPVDLDRAMYLGMDSLNPRLYAGNRIEVPYRSHERVQVVGEVQRPREIELLPEDNVESLLLMAGGVRRSVTEPVVELMGQAGRTLTGSDVVTGGIIGVRDARMGADLPVFIVGEVNAPGEYKTSEGTTLEQVLRAAGGAMPSANLPRVTVFRLAELERWNTTEQFRYAIDGLLSNAEMTSFAIRSGDSIVVPRTMGFVKVGGLVVRKATVPYVAGKSVSHYVNAVGGFLPSANRTEVNLVNRITRLASRVHVSAHVQDGDEIVVVPLEEKP